MEELAQQLQLAGKVPAAMPQFPASLLPWHSPHEPGIAPARQETGTATSVNMLRT
jgi:hypothetical protein